MFTRPSLRAVIATGASAVVLVGGASLVSYAANGHVGHAGGAAKPAAKTMVFRVGKAGHKFHGGDVALFRASVPKGSYETSMSGIVVDTSSTDGDSITCLISDERTLTHLLTHPGSLSAERIYNLLGQNQVSGGGQIGFVDQTNPAAKIDRKKITYGCIFNGTGPFQVVRPLQFTLTPVKVDNQKKGKPYHVPATKLHDLSRALR